MPHPIRNRPSRVVNRCSVRKFGALRERREAMKQSMADQGNLIVTEPAGSADRRTPPADGTN
jgi:hypothetical protein